MDKYVTTQGFLKINNQSARIALSSSRPSFKTLISSTGSKKYQIFTPWMWQQVCAVTLDLFEQILQTFFCGLFTRTNKLFFGKCPIQCVRFPLDRKVGEITSQGSLKVPALNKTFSKDSLQEGSFSWVAGSVRPGMSGYSSKRKILSQDSCWKASSEILQFSWQFGRLAFRVNAALLVKAQWGPAAKIKVCRSVGANTSCPTWVGVGGGRRQDRPNTDMLLDTRGHGMHAHARAHAHKLIPRCPPLVNINIGVRY